MTKENREMGQRFPSVRMLCVLFFLVLLHKEPGFAQNAAPGQLPAAGSSAGYKVKSSHDLMGTAAIPQFSERFFNITPDDSVTTDTVCIISVDSFITHSDTGASAKRIGWTPGPVLMSHTVHEKAGISCIVCHHRKNNDDRIKQCSRCHKGVSGAERIHDKCGKCHMTRNMSLSCDKCHIEKEGKPQAELLRFKFSHNRHYSRKQECRFCHAEPQKTEWLKKDDYPAMKTCLSCHDNRKSSGQCSVCHNDVAQIKPKSHNYSWVGRNGHGLDANYNKTECLQCHSNRECDRCHLGQTSCRIHSPGYRFVHGMDVRMGLINCSMCHETRYFCSQCHENRR